MASFPGKRPPCWPSDLICCALQKTKGNRTRAADLLEISHRALLYKIKDAITDL